MIRYKKDILREIHCFWQNCYQ